MSQQSPQLPPTTAISPDAGLTATTEKWFEYPVRVYPHQTDYAGAVWHGTYITWMEEARVEYLRSLGFNFADFVQLGCDLSVVELSLRYHRSISMGETAIVKARMREIETVRIVWDYRIESPDSRQLYVTSQVTLVAVDREKGKIMRQIPPLVQEALVKLLNH